MAVFLLCSHLVESRVRKQASSVPFLTKALISSRERHPQDLVTRHHTGELRFQHRGLSRGCKRSVQSTNLETQLFVQGAGKPGWAEGKSWQWRICNKGLSQWPREPWSWDSPSECPELRHEAQPLHLPVDLFLGAGHYWQRVQPCQGHFLGRASASSSQGSQGTERLSAEGGSWGRPTAPTAAATGSPSACILKVVGHPGPLCDGFHQQGSCPDGPSHCIRGHGVPGPGVTHGTSGLLPQSTRGLMPVGVNVGHSAPALGSWTGPFRTALSNRHRMWVTD